MCANQIDSTSCPRNLSDFDKDGQLNIDEFALAMHFVELAKNGQALPHTVPPELLPPSFQPRQPSGSFTGTLDSRERSDSGCERSGSFEGRSRSGSTTSTKGVCEFCFLQRSNFKRYPTLGKMSAYSCTIQNSNDIYLLVIQLSAVCWSINSWMYSSVLSIKAPLWLACISLNLFI